MIRPQHLLVFRFSSLGDVAMTVPVIKLLLQQGAVYCEKPQLVLRIAISHNAVEPTFQAILYEFACYHGLLTEEFIPSLINAATTSSLTLDPPCNTSGKRGSFSCISFRMCNCNVIFFVFR